MLMKTGEIYSKDEVIRLPIQAVFIGVYADSVGRFAAYEFAFDLFWRGKDLLGIKCFFQKATKEILFWHRL